VIRVVLLIPSELFRQSLAALIRGMAGIEDVRETWSAIRCARMIQLGQPGLVIVDDQYPDAEMAIKLFRGVNPSARILMLIKEPSAEALRRAHAYGADECAFRSASAQDLELAIHRAVSAT
jgi:DNA-binding NarL/FixJ family response regulator